MNPATQTRKSKIARLPRAIREQLNRRLDDGEASPSLLEWLNTTPGVQEILAAEFADREITEENLSDWRQGGFQDWLQSQDQLAGAQSIIEATDDLSDASGNQDMLDRVSNLAALGLGKLLRTLNPADAGYQAALLSVTRELARLRKMDIETRKLRLERDKWEAENARQNAKDLAAEDERLRNKPAEVLDRLMYEGELLDRAKRTMTPQSVEAARKVFEETKKECSRQLSSLLNAVTMA